VWCICFLSVFERYVSNAVAWQQLSWVTGARWDRQHCTTVGCYRCQSLFYTTSSSSLSFYEFSAENNLEVITSSILLVFLNIARNSEQLESAVQHDRYITAQSATLGLHPVARKLYYSFPVPSAGGRRLRWPEHTVGYRSLLKAVCKWPGRHSNSRRKLMGLVVSSILYHYRPLAPT